MGLVGTFFFALYADFMFMMFYDIGIEYNEWSIKAIVIISAIIFNTLLFINRDKEEGTNT